MIPTNFPESNTVMTRPADMTAEQCSDIHAFRDGKCVVTCWKPTAAERVRLAMGEPVYLYIVGASMPPVLLTVDSPFVEPVPPEISEPPQEMEPHPWGATREQVIEHIREQLTDGLPASVAWLESLAQMQETDFWMQVAKLYDGLNEKGQGT